MSGQPGGAVDRRRAKTVCSFYVARPHVCDQGGRRCKFCGLAQRAHPLLWGIACVAVFFFPDAGMVRSFNVTLLDLRLFALLVCDFGLVVRSQDAAARSSQQPEAAIISLPALGMEDSQDFSWGALHAQKWLATPQVWL